MAATTLGLQLDVLQASTEAQLNDAFITLHEKRVGVLVIVTDVFFNGHASLLATLAIRYLLPAIYEYHPFASAGGLISYGGSITDSYHLAGVYAGRILKGEKPGELPVQQSTKVELIINLKPRRRLASRSHPRCLPAPTR